MKELICLLLFTQEPTIDVSFANVPSQENTCDCGLFAMAFVTAICEGRLQAKQPSFTPAEVFSRREDYFWKGCKESKPGC